ncbi:hypothetical protein MED217_05442 [Leeuwenhoekiella blandensis MED217]|uniref:Uncharacterized protein n=1 Tax=Leeuwenhoekiella blandensis (strain CECT 7118 / CCUG 51940 / KCTC 22103 / MED217) TaxID=398720 RepID=A3XJ23_LEEBM|nr:hypothetical protein MED217_05442 [Leeuwenhoekiella blandensis MED217]
MILASVWVLLKYCLIKIYHYEGVSNKPKISLQEAEAHYQSNKKKYTIEGAESHLAYYREKYPEYYAVLSQNV